MTEPVDPQTPARAAHPVAVPLTVAAGIFMETLDSTIIATSLPQMARSLAVNPIHLSFAITSYLLSMAIFTLISGWLADRFGARRIFLTAIIIFTVSSAFCALAQNLAFLVVMRTLQGIGGAMLTPVARLILARVFPKSMLITVTTYMAVPALIGPMMGPVIGGFLTQYLSWRWIFLINIPIGLLGLFLTQRIIPDIPRRLSPFDVPGFLIVGLSFALGQLWLQCLGQAIFPPYVQASLALGAVTAFLLYIRYARNHPNPVLDLKLFRLPSFGISIVWGGFARSCISGTPFLLPLLLQAGFGFDPVHAGLLMLVTSTGALFMRLGFNRLLRMLGLRLALILNTSCLGGLLAGFCLIHATTPQWMTVAYLFVFGFVRSIQLFTLSMLGYADLTPETVTHGNTLSMIAARLSMSGGVALAAVMLSLATGGAPMNESHFRLVFLGLAAIELIPIVGFRRLQPTVGKEITGG